MAYLIKAYKIEFTITAKKVCNLNKNILQKIIYF